jgi:ribonuclease J
VGRFGGNALAIELGAPNEILMVDMGLGFVAPPNQGLATFSPDFSLLKPMGKRLVAYAITHGHDDHIGALPQAHGMCPAPIFATAFTADLIRRRFANAGQGAPPISVMAPGEKRRVGAFELEFVSVAHSVPDAAALAVHTPWGTLIHSGDFGLDADPPLGRKTDLDRLNALGDAGVLALCADSTGAATPGRGRDELDVWPPLRDAVRTTPGRVFFSTFASHLGRLSLFLRACRQAERRVGLVGRAVRELVDLGQRRGWIRSPDLIGTPDEIRELPANRQAWVLSGSQGEWGGAFRRVAEGGEAGLSPGPTDALIHSARAIPGHELAVAQCLDLFAQQGARVFSGHPFHASGHGQAEDLRELIRATRPQHLIPVHGAPRHLAAHRHLALAEGMEDSRVHLLGPGASLHLHGGEVSVEEGEVEDWVVTANGEAIRDAGVWRASRQRMSEGGLLWIWAQKSGAQCHDEGLFPPLGDAERRQLAQALSGWRPRNQPLSSEDAEDARRRVLRVFRKLKRRPPHVVVKGPVDPCP